MKCLKYTIFIIISLYLVNYLFLYFNTPSGSLPADFFIEDPLGRGSKLNPNRVHDIIRAGHSFRVKVDINGHRQSQLDLKEKNENVLIVGSSIAFGYGLNYEDSLIGLVEREYKHRFNFINASSYGYGSYHSLLTIANECTTYSPKYIIYIYEYKNSREDFLKKKPFQGLNNDNNMKAPFNFKDFLLFVPTREFFHNNNIHPTQIYEKIIGISNLSKKYKSKYLYYKELDPLAIKNLDTVVDHVNSMSALSAYCGARFILIVTPSPYESYYGISEMGTDYLLSKLPLIKVIDLREINALGEDLFLRGLDYPGKYANQLYKTYISKLNIL